jgi:hypothetical protein
MRTDFARFAVGPRYRNRWRKRDDTQYGDKPSTGDSSGDYVG